MNPRSDEPREARGEPSDVPREGDIIAGRYRVERVLGQGGMGVVVAARHTSLRQRVAVKFLRPTALKLPGASARFLREAQAAAAIQSEHVARVTDMGTLATGSPFMVMEHLDGTDLSSVIKERGALPIKDAVDYVLQACEALAEAHKLGIVHRDLKPSNIFVTARADGTPLIKVLDFGLSKVLDPDAAFAAESSLTETEMVVGSPHYMSPEHVRSLKYVDARTDIWSLGVILYQLLSGRRPFDGESLPSVFARIVADPPDPLRDVSPNVPQGLEAAVVCCLEKDVRLRFQTVSEFARAIAPFGPETSRISAERIERVQPSLRASGTGLPVVVQGEDATTASIGTWARTKLRARSRRTAVAFAAGGAAVVGAIVTASVILIARDSGRGGALGGERPVGAASEAGAVVIPTIAVPTIAIPTITAPTGAAMLSAIPEAAAIPATAVAITGTAAAEPTGPGAQQAQAAGQGAAASSAVAAPSAPQGAAPTTPTSSPRTSSETTARPPVKQDARGAPAAAGGATAPGAPAAPKREGSALDRWD